MKTSFYSNEELNEIGFKKIGKNVLISRNACIYGASRMVIGDNVRIDDFCILSGKIELGSHVHIAVHSCIFAGETGVKINDFAGVSSRSAIYAESDDYSGEYLTNPTVDEDVRKVICGRVDLGRHVLLGTGTTVLPGVTIGEGTAVGCMSLVNKPLDSWGIYAGVPCRLKKERAKSLLICEKELAEKENAGFEK